jgi:hypothetical protein
MVHFNIQPQQSGARGLCVCAPERQYARVNHVAVNWWGFGMFVVCISGSLQRHNPSFN